MASTKHCTTDPTEEIRVKTTLSGPSSVAPVTVCDLIKRASKKFGPKPAMCVKRDGRWQQTTFKEYYEKIVLGAKALIKLEVEPFHGVGVLGFNSPEWFIASLSAILCGALSSGVYATNNEEACHHVLSDCKAQAVFCENKAQVAKILNIKDRLPNLKVIVQYMPGPVDSGHRDAGVIHWDEFILLGKDLPDYEVQWRIEKQRPGNCCSLIYTSGTTGPPKGVMLSHDNVTWTSKVCGSLFGLGEEEHMISYLPLSHIAAQMLDLYAPLQYGITVWFAQPDALRGSLVQTLKEVRPTAFMGVPRVWEKLRDKIQEQFDGYKGMKSRIVEGAKSVGRCRSAKRMDGDHSKPWGYWLANRFCFSPLREAIGMDRCRNQLVGAAPIAKNVLHFFLDLDIPIYEIYGMSESSGPQTVSFDGQHRSGTSGKLMAGCEMKIDKPDEFGEGEVCFRGRHVFMGYLGQEEKTVEAIDEDGWLHSGDIGKVDKEGYLSITGRLKELIITKGGENVAPVLIEEEMKKQMPCLSHVIVVGDDQKYLTMLVSFKVEAEGNGAPSDNLDSVSLGVMNNIGSKARSVTEVREDDRVSEYIRQGMQSANETAISNAQKVQKFTILPEDLSPLGDKPLLTPTLKLKRKTIVTKYKDLIDKMYEE